MRLRVRVMQVWVRVELRAGQPINDPSSQRRRFMGGIVSDHQGRAGSLIAYIAMAAAAAALSDSVPRRIGMVMRR